MAPSYAVLFKCHFWDAFTQRQFERLTSVVGRGEVYVFIDRTSGSTGTPPHDPERIIEATESDIEALGLARHGDYNHFWYNADYALHLLTRRRPDYDYYVTVEFDVVVNADIDPLIDALAGDEVDFVGQPIADPPLEQFHWLPTARGVYELSDMRHWLTCIAVFSRRAAHALFDRRLALSGRYQAGEITSWPMCEIALPTEMNIGQFRMKPLDELGSLQFYHWTPPYDEAALPDLQAGTFVHPVLDTSRFVTKIMHWHPDHSEFFDRESLLRRRFAGVQAKRLALPFLFDEARRQGRLGTQARIFELMHEVGDEAYLAHHGRDGRNLALDRPTTQSSWINGRAPGEPTSEAVVGIVTGTASFHTEADDRPWWMVDLGAPVPIEEVRVFNRMDERGRADGLIVLVSDDLRDWREAGRHEGASFGGSDGSPLVVPVRAAARFVRVELPRKEYLHLDQVQVIRPLRR